MKTFFLIAVVTLSTSMAAFAQSSNTTPILRGKLQSNLDANRFSITNVVDIKGTNGVSLLSGGSGITNAYATNTAGILVSGSKVFISTNYDARGAAADVGSSTTNYVNSSVATKQDTISVVYPIKKTSSTLSAPDVVTNTQTQVTLTNIIGRLVQPADDVSNGIPIILRGGTLIRGDGLDSHFSPGPAIVQGGANQQDGNAAPGYLLGGNHEDPGFNATEGLGGEAIVSAGTNSDGTVTEKVSLAPYGGEIFAGSHFTGPYAPARTNAATTSVLGLVKPDGTSITIVNGTISSTTSATNDTSKASTNAPTIYNLQLAGTSGTLGFSTNYGLSFTTNYAQIVISGAGTAATIGTYDLAGTLPVSGLIYYTNTTLANGFLIVSNGFQAASPVWCITNSGTVYYRSGVGANNTPFGFQTIVSGSAPAPTQRGYVVTITNGVNPYTQLYSTYPLLTPFVNSNNLVTIETWGDDLVGRAGNFPFKTLDAALWINTNAFPVRIGAGTFNMTNLTAGVPISLRYGQSLFGVGREVSILADTNITSTITSPQGRVAITNNNTIRGLSIQGVIVAPSTSINVTNLLMEDCQLGTNSSIDCLFFSGLSVNGLYNSRFNRVRFISSWDTTQGIISADFTDCEWVMDGSYTTNTVGIHALSIGSLTGQLPVNYTVVGGTFTITNCPTPTVATAQTNAVFYCLGTNDILTLKGPRLTYPSNCVAIYNYNGSTNINGWYWDNGRYTVISNGITVASISPNGSITGTVVSATTYVGLPPVLTNNNNQAFVIFTNNLVSISESAAGVFTWTNYSAAGQGFSWTTNGGVSFGGWQRTAGNSTNLGANYFGSSGQANFDTSGNLITSGKVQAAAGSGVWVGNPGIILTKASSGLSFPGSRNEVLQSGWNTSCDQGFAGNIFILASTNGAGLNGGMTIYGIATNIVGLSGMPLAVPIDVRLNGSFTATNGFIFQLTAKSANYTNLISDAIITMNGTSLTLTLTNPVAFAGRIVRVINKNASSLTVTNLTDGATPNTTKTVSQGGSLSVFSDGVDWLPVAEYAPALSIAQTLTQPRTLFAGLPLLGLGFIVIRRRAQKRKQLKAWREQRVIEAEIVEL